MKLIKKRSNKREISKNIVVVYHGDCTDGFSAAWAAWKKFGNKAEYLGIDPGELLPTGLEDKEIYMLDVLSKSNPEEVIKGNKKFVVIDHHKTNMEVIQATSGNLFDLNHSAAVLAWNYFFPKIKTPKLLKYVEDIDIYKLELPHTHEMSAAMDLLDFSFENWSKLAKDLEDGPTFKKYTEKGRIVLQYQNKIIERLATNNLEPVRFSGFVVYAVNSPNFSSQIGNILAKKSSSFGIVWFEKNDGSVHVSLRSIGDVDVSKIAEKFGGGGHKHSAGFDVENHSKIPWSRTK